MLETKPGQFLLLATEPGPLAPGHCHGDGRVRTDDPLLAKQVLSQLSYVPFGESPVASKKSTLRQLATGNRQLVMGQGGLEPPTPRLSSDRCALRLDLTN